MRTHLASIEGTDFDFDKACQEKFGTVGVCLGDYDEKSEVNTDMAIYKWTNGDFMTEEEIKKLPEEKRPKLHTPPKMPNLDECERVYIDKNEMKVNEIQAEQEKLSNFL